MARDLSCPGLDQDRAIHDSRFRLSVLISRLYRCEEGWRWPEEDLCVVSIFPSFPLILFDSPIVPSLPSSAAEPSLTPSNDYMKVQLAKIKAENEKSGTKNDHKVYPLPLLTLFYQKLTYKSNFKKVAETWKTAYVHPIISLINADNIAPRTPLVFFSLHSHFPTQGPG